MATKKEYQNLLDEVKDEKSKSLNKGDLFNIFGIIGKSSDEVNIHSKFLAMLLNPKGKHGCGDAFLRTFCKTTSIDISRFDLDKAEVFAEYSIGPIRKNRTEGGRIDILIRFGKEYAIIIENKIYAGDQENQLMRYRNYAKSFKSFVILYLTLDGHAPDKKSTHEGDDGNAYWSEISYESDIKDWLGKWLELKRSENKTWIYPIVKQYVDLIDSITGNDVDASFTEKLCNLLGEANNLAFAGEMKKEIFDAKIKIINIFCSKLKKSANEKGLSSETDNEPDEDDPFIRLYMSKKKWKCCLVFEIDTNAFYCKFGIVLDNDKITDFRRKEIKDLENELRNLQDYRNDHSWWMIWDYLPDEFEKWNAETFVSVKNDSRNLLGILEEKLDTYVPILDELSKKTVRLHYEQNFQYERFSL